MIQPTSTNCPVSGQEEMNAVKKTTSQTSWFCLSLTRCSRVQTSFCWSASSTLPYHSSPLLPGPGCAPFASPYSCFPGSGLNLKKNPNMLLLLFWPFFFGGGGWIPFPFNTNVPVGLSVNYMAFGNWFSDAIDLSRILPAYSRIWWDLLSHRTL